MDDQALMQTYGNTDLREGTEDRPLVTFALFAYNQEKYIREAVEGAFSQTYSPLEIILSDDCSSDRTFEIIQEMANEYRGPHSVRIRRNEVNLGTALHVYNVAVLCRGSIFVVAAGDDISRSSRCTSIVKHWSDCTDQVACVHSGAIFFDHDFGKNEVYRPPRAGSLRSESERTDFLKRGQLPFLSPTCAYSIDVFKEFDPIIGGSIIEDGVTAFRSLALGSIISIDEPLVLVRRQDETSGTGYSILSAKRWNRFILSRIVSYSTILRDTSLANIDNKTSACVQDRCLRSVRNLARFLIKTDQKNRLLFRIRFLILYITIYPTSAPLLNKFANSFEITGFSDTPIFNLSKAIYRHLRR